MTLARCQQALRLEDWPAAANRQVWHWNAAGDNYEPYPRLELNGYLISWTHEDGHGKRLWIPEDVTEGFPIGNLIKCNVLFDTGRSVTPYYFSGYSPAHHVAFMSSFPLSQGTRPDNGRPIDMSTWRIGPRKTYHLKARRLIHGHNRTDGKWCRWSWTPTRNPDGLCPDRCQEN